MLDNPHDAFGKVMMDDHDYAQPGYTYEYRGQVVGSTDGSRVLLNEILLDNEVNDDE
jgi:hypothetical protein